jgi:predicted Zn finger-like uncharacterized protein
MKLAEGIRRHGFRKWYERELLQGHAHMVLCIIAVLGLLMVFENAGRAQSLASQWDDLAAGVLCAGAGLWALRRYLHLLAHAEAVAHQADCPHCGTYGRMELLQSDPSGDTVQVRCRKCGSAWRIDG